MTDAESSPAPRRSQREKRQATHFISVNSALSKRKRSDETDEEAADAPSDPDHDASGDEDADVEGGFSSPKQKPKGKGKGKAKTPTKPKGPPASKKPRTAKKAPPVPKPKKVPGARRGRKPTTGAEGAGFSAEKVARDTKIAGDNALYNAIMNPSAALQSTVEDFLESLTQTPGPSQAELVNCILRCCGCNDTVNEDEAVDYDGVVDALDNFTEALKNDDSPVYPLTSKLPAFKKFRKSLSEFLTRLITSAAPLEQLYSSDLLPTMQTWVVAMSSSHLRAFRHTATVIALEVETALCEVAADVEKEAETNSRQKGGEQKRKAKAKQTAPTAREKEIDAKGNAIRERRAKLAEFLKEFVDGVFVHRYRDLDPSIRAECVRAMGLWFSKYPSHFLDGTYLRYVGWVLSDSNTQVRLEAVRALSLAYAQNEYIGAGALQHFTERFKPRLVEMAMGDTELSVRVAVIQVLQAINTHGLLEDEQAEKLCLLIFDEEAKVRKAVSGFVKGVWQEGVDERLVGRRTTEKDKQRAGIKVLASLLVQWSRALDSTIRGEEEEEDEDDTSQSEAPTRRAKGKAVAALFGSKEKGRTALAVEALWDEVEPVSDWETILDILVLDHSAVDEDGGPRGRRNTGKQPARDAAVDEVWRLEEVEESVLLEVFITALRRTKHEATGGKKGEDETVSSEITRALIKALPRLFIKYQTDEGRMANVILLPQLMNLEEYLDMRMMTAYGSLWDDVTKQFLSHSSQAVLTNAVHTIRYLMDATSLSNTNSTKILELEDELASSLRDTITDRDEIERASFNEDEVLALTAICSRLAAFVGNRDMIAWMEEDEGGKQSSAWDIISALSERGKLGYKEEEMMVDQALQVLYLHILWKARALNNAPDPSPDEVAFREKLKEQRGTLLARLQEFAVGTQSNTAEGVRRAAFQNLMHLHILFCPTESIAPNGSQLPTAQLALSLTEEEQHPYAGFIQTEIERYAEELEESAPPHEDESEDDDSGMDQSDDEGKAKGKKKGKGKQTKGATVHATTSSAQLEREYVFIGVMATFLRAIKAGVIHFRHAVTLLAHYGRLGPVFDQCAKIIVEILREEGMYKSNGETVVAVVLQALRESFLLYLDGVTRTEEHSVALGKLLATCFLIRGAQLSVVRRLDSEYVVETHTSALTWFGKRLSAYEAAKNKKARNKCLVFFKVLAPLLVAVDTRDAMKIKAHLDQVLAQAKAEPLPTSKIWDGYRAYEKRLTTAKDKAPGKAKKGPKKGHKSAEMITTDDDGEGELEADVEEILEVPNGVSTPRPKVVPRRVRRPVPPIGSGTDGEGEPEAHENDEEDNPPSEPEPVTPKQRPRPKPVPKLNVAISPSSQSRPSASPAPSSPLTPSSPGPFVTPGNTRKRARSDDDDEHDGDAVMESAGEAQSPLSQPPASPSGSHTSEIQIKRKRVRH